MGILEETKVAQAINRFENVRALLDEVNSIDKRFNEIINPIIKTLTDFEKQLREIKGQLNVENLGVKEQKGSR